jgi:hypothetical protein
MGMLNGNPVLFDIGNLSYETKTLKTKEFVQKQAKLVFATLNKEIPKLSSFLEEEIEQITMLAPESTP